MNNKSSKIGSIWGLFPIIRERVREEKKLQSSLKYGEGGGVEMEGDVCSWNSVL